MWRYINKDYSVEGAERKKNEQKGNRASEIWGTPSVIPIYIYIHNGNLREKKEKEKISE